MPSHLGKSTKNIFYKELSNLGLTQQFQQDGLSYTMTLSAAPITGNVIAGNIGSAAISTTYATSAAATMAVLIAAIAASPGVKSATVNGGNTVITIIPTDQTLGVPIIGWAVTGGSSQPTVAIAQINNNIKRGMPVMLLTNGNIAPADPTALTQKCIGYAIDRALSLPDGTSAPILPAEITIGLRGYAIITMEAAAALSPGPVALSAYNYVTDNNVVTGSGITDDTLLGWSIDAATSAGNLIRVIVRN